MFKLFKKHDRKAQHNDSAETMAGIDSASQAAGDSSREELVAQAEALDERIAGAAGASLADLLDKKGELLAQAGETDRAIAAYEASMGAANRMGQAYRGLTALYNIKRREAAQAGNDAAAREFLDKLQSLMQGSKDLLRGK